MARRRRSRKPPGPKRKITLALQDFHIRRHFSSFSSRIRGNRAVWRGILQPSITSPQYLVEIRYKLQGTPKVWVLSPPLVPGVEHLYKDKNLCLYWPEEWRWRPDQLIAKTIIPWTASWLGFYELWLDTGKWLGPSSHDNPLVNGEN